MHKNATKYRNKDLFLVVNMYNDSHVFFIGFVQVEKRLSRIFETASSVK